MRNEDKWLGLISYNYSKLGYNTLHQFSCLIGHIYMQAAAKYKSCQPKSRIIQRRRNHVTSTLILSCLSVLDTRTRVWNPYLTLQISLKTPIILSQIFLRKERRKRRRGEDYVIYAQNWVWYQNFNKKTTKGNSLMFRHACICSVTWKRTRFCKVV